MSFVQDVRAGNYTNAQGRRYWSRCPCARVIVQKTATADSTTAHQIHSTVHTEHQHVELVEAHAGGVTQVVQHASWSADLKCTYMYVHHLLAHINIQSGATIVPPRQNLPAQTPQKTSASADTYHHIGSLPKSNFLTAHVLLASADQARGHIGVLCQLLQHGVDLLGQLTSGRDHEHSNGSHVPRAIQQALQERQHEGCTRRLVCIEG